MLCVLFSTASSFSSSHLRQNTRRATELRLALSNLDTVCLRWVVLAFFYLPSELHHPHKNQSNALPYCIFRCHHTNWLHYCRFTISNLSHIFNSPWAAVVIKARAAPRRLQQLFVKRSTIVFSRRRRRRAHWKKCVRLTSATSCWLRFTKRVYTIDLTTTITTTTIRATAPLLLLLVMTIILQSKSK